MLEGHFAFVLGLAGVAIFAGGFVLGYAVAVNSLCRVAGIDPLIHEHRHPEPSETTEAVFPRDYRGFRQ